MATSQIQIQGAVSFNSEKGENLLRAALREGLGFPYECNSGSCGSCQFELLEGNVEDLWSQAPGLSPKARTAGRRLACQSTVAGDCRIKVRLKSEFVSVKTGLRRTARFMGREALTADMSEYSFRCEGAADFVPGQYALLQLPSVKGERAYSMSNLPNGQGIWKFIVKRVANGAGTTALAERLQEGDCIDLDGPYGMAYLRPEIPRDLVCIGGGSGLSPLKSILSAAVREPALQNRRIHLFYGGRTPTDICIDRVLDEDKILRDRVETVVAISDLNNFSEWRGERGFIHEVLRSWLAAGREAKEYEYYFCGPPPMTDAVQRLLVLDHRVDMAHIHFDRFL